ncbi:GCD complex subunit gcd7 [Tulasnella sp. 427]|nr:GCD complex subunit gcd7 [Tulasnella sp. 427]
MKETNVIKDKATQKHVEALVSKLRRRQVVGSHATAIETVLLMRQVISAARFTSLDQLVTIVKAAGRQIIEAQPKEHSIGNIVRKVLRLIREEFNAAAAAAGATSSQGSTPPARSRNLPPPTPASAAVPASSSLSNFVLLGHPRSHQSLAVEQASRGLTRQSSMHSEQTEDFKAMSVKPVLIDAIKDVIDELETVYDGVAKNARDHIHSDEIILTIGKSRTVEAFLKGAAHYRKFTVIVAETAPSFSGRDMAQSLSASGISTVLVPDSCVYALMSRVNKVILGAHAVLANGGVFAISGSLIAASAARAHATPVVICTGQYKFTPLWNLYHEYAAVDFGDPAQVLAMKDTEGIDMDKVDIVNPYYDYVKPELVDVLITNEGDHPPSYVYRVVKEAYDEEDSDL